MRGSPVIESMLITLVIGVLGFAGMRFIQAGSATSPIDPQVEAVALDVDAIDVEIACYFSDKPESYSLMRPEGESASDQLILKAEGSEQGPDFHDVVLKNQADGVIWLDVKWAAEKPQGHYFVELVMSVGNQEPITRTFRTSADTLQGTIELDLTNLNDDE